MTPSSWHAYAARALEREQDRTPPWDHPYDGTPDDEMVCVHCGLIGSYAHTREFYQKWVYAS